MKQPRETSSTEEILSLEESFPFQIAMVHYATAKFIHSHHERFGLTSNQWKVLSVVAHRGPLPSTEVTNWCSLDKPAVSRAVQKLVGSDLIRLGGRGSGTRAVDLDITSAGLAIQREVAHKIADFQAWLFDDMDEAQQRWLLDKMNHLRNRLAGFDFASVRAQERPERSLVKMTD